MPGNKRTKSAWSPFSMPFYFQWYIQWNECLRKSTTIRDPFSPIYHLFPIIFLREFATKCLICIPRKTKTKMNSGVNKKKRIYIFNLKSFNKNIIRLDNDPCIIDKVKIVIMILMSVDIVWLWWYSSAIIYNIILIILQCRIQYEKRNIFIGK